MIHMQHHRLTGAVFVLPGLAAGHAAAFVMPQDTIAEFQPFTGLIEVRAEGEAD